MNYTKYFIIIIICFLLFFIFLEGIIMIMSHLSLKVIKSTVGKDIKNHIDKKLIDKYLDLLQFLTLLV